MPSVVQSAMRPNLSPLEYGAYGTPSRVVSVEVGGPQVSSVGRADRMSTRFIGAMIARRVCDVVRSWGKPEGQIASIFVEVRVVVFSGAMEILAVSERSRDANIDANRRTEISHNLTLRSKTLLNWIHYHFSLDTNIASFPSSSSLLRVFSSLVVVPCQVPTLFVLTWRQINPNPEWHCQ